MKMKFTLKFMLERFGFWVDFGFFLLNRAHHFFPTVTRKHFEFARISAYRTHVNKLVESIGFIKLAEKIRILI